MSLTTHKVITITQKAVISSRNKYSSLGTYSHYILFNTNIDIERMYRVDITYVVPERKFLWIVQQKRVIVNQSIHAEEKVQTGFLFWKYTFYNLEEYNQSYNKVTYKWKIWLNNVAANLERISVSELSQSPKIESVLILRLAFLDPNGEYHDLPADDVPQDSNLDNDFNNPPSGQDVPDLGWLEEIKAQLTDFMNWAVKSFNSTVNFMKANWSWISIVLIVFVCLMFLTPAIIVLKALWTIFKLLLHSIKTLLKLLFLPFTILLLLSGSKERKRNDRIYYNKNHNRRF